MFETPVSTSNDKPRNRLLRFVFDDTIISIPVNEAGTFADVAESLAILERAGHEHIQGIALTLPVLNPPRCAPNLKIVRPIL